MGRGKRNKKSLSRHPGEISKFKLSDRIAAIKEFIKSLHKVALTIRKSPGSNPEGYIFDLGGMFILFPYDTEKYIKWEKASEDDVSMAEAALEMDKLYFA